MDHLGIDTTTARHAIITGDPDRVPAIVNRLGGGRGLTNRRGLSCWESSHAGGGPVLVVAAGIGAPSTAIVVEELAEIGIHTIIRVGTCGGLLPDVSPNDLVVPTGCVRDEGTSRQYVELAFPAVPDLSLTAALLAAVGGRGIRCHAGIVHCKDAYYLEHANRQLLPDAVAQRWRALRGAGVLATEMESSILFVLGSLRRLRAASVLISVGHESDPEGFGAALDVAVASISQVFASLEPPTGILAALPVGVRNSYLGTDG